MTEPGPSGPGPSEPGPDLHHHGDAEVGGSLLDFAVNVYPGPRPPWLEAALRASLDDVGAYPSAAPAQAAVAAHHEVTPEQVLVTAGAAEAFTLVARLRAWGRPVVVHPQFTEPHAALEQAGHRVDPVVLSAPFTLDPGQVAALIPDDADLVVIGNPTNPTGVLHPIETLHALLRPGRLVVVDEAFIDCVGEQASVIGHDPGLLVLRSLTKHWSMPGVRAGYLIGAPDVVASLARQQVPWSVATTAAAAVAACMTPEAARESKRRATEIATWRDDLVRGLDVLGVEHLPSAASFVLAHVGAGVHGRLREHGIAVRRADTFPGLDDTWVRIAVRPASTTTRLLTALAAMP